MPNIKTRKSKDLLQTIQRMSLALDILGRNPRGSSLKNLSNEIKLPKATTHRLLNSLLFFGFVRQETKSKDYFLGFKLAELGNLVIEQIDIRRIAEPFLRDLMEKTNETVHLVILDRSEVVYIDKLEPKRSGGLKMASLIGLRNPCHCSAVGKVLLAYLADEELNIIIKDKGLPKRTENTIIDFFQLKKHLKRVRAQGFAVDDEENEIGVRCIAAPIFNENRKAVAAISVSGPALRITKKIIKESFKKCVVEAAFTISKKMRFKLT